MHAPKALLVVLALSACAPPVPDSGPGVGFGDYSDYVRQREAQRQAAVVPAKPVFSTERAAAAIDAAGQPVAVSPTQGRLITGEPLNGVRPRGGAPAGIKEESGEMNPGSSRISDEQDFGAVSSRESIESDAERLARQRAQYEVVAPTALPQRSGSSGPNIVEFALSTTHAPGTQVYKRGSLFGGNAAAACSRFASPDLAQEAFLADGGPQKDRKGLDPDGDGFACGWDPRPFRTALR